MRNVYDHLRCDRCGLTYDTHRPDSLLCDEFVLLVDTYNSADLATAFAAMIVELNQLRAEVRQLRQVTHHH